MTRMAEPAASALAFEYLAEIAVGSTSRVDLCRVVDGSRTGQLVAVKRLLPHIAEDPSFSTMFLDEVWMTALLKHANVVEVAGWGQDAEGPYLAVELVQGVSLARLMKTVFETGEAFSERMVVFVCSRLCRGLEAAHGLRSAQGELLYLVHRDLSPGNVLVGFNGDVKIADFGLAKAKQRLTKTLTGTLKGQPQYMSPEQAKGGIEIDARSDLFSLGVLMFELFAGRRPWSAQSELEMVHVAATEPPGDLRELRPKIDKELVSVVMRCLEKDPNARFQSAAEVGRRLEDWLRTHGYVDGAEDALGRFVRRNAMRQMRWFERAVAGELAPMPDSMRPLPPKVAPPRVPSYTSPSSLPLVASKRTLPTSSGSPRARVRSRRPLDSEQTDVTDAEAKVAALHAESGRQPPRIVGKDGRPVPHGDIDWGEEIPTLVQQGQENPVLARVRPRGPGGARPFEEPMVDEDSQRTTAVKRTSHGTSATAPDVGSGSLGARRASVVDAESEELPTLPLKRGMHKNLPGQIVPPTAGVPPPPIPRPPTPRDARSGAPGRDAGPRPGSSRPPPSVATPSGVRAAPPPGFDGAGAVAAAGSVVAPGSDASPVPPVARPPQAVTEQVLLGEADRLAMAAVRLGEEAKAAAALAVRKTTQAKIANDAAMIAAEAVRVAASSGIAAGARRLDEALALEASVLRGEGSVPPGPTPISGIHPSVVAGGGSPRATGEVPVAPSGPPPMPPEHALIGAFDVTGVLPPQPEGTISSLDVHRPSAFDPMSFRARLQPTVLGLPRNVVLGMGSVVLTLLVILLWRAC